MLLDFDVGEVMVCDIEPGTGQILCKAGLCSCDGIWQAVPRSSMVTFQEQPSTMRNMLFAISLQEKRCDKLGVDGCSTLFSLILAGLARTALNRYIYQVEMLRYDLTGSMSSQTNGYVHPHVGPTGTALKGAR
jgi:hypothetical protein